MGFFSNLFGAASEQNLDAIKFVASITGFDARIGSRTEMIEQGKYFAYNSNPIDSPNPNFINPSAATLAGELIYLMNAHEEQNNKVAIKHIKIAMAKFLEKYQRSCPSAYMAFMSTAYSSNS